MNPQAAQAPTPRLVLLDLEGPCEDDLDLAALRALLTAARERRLPIIHGFRNGQDGPRRAPLEGLAPLPDEPVFIRDEPVAFSSRAFTAWVGPPPASLILVGAEQAVSASTRSAVEAGHYVHTLMRPANGDGPDDHWRQLHPHLPARFPAPAVVDLEGFFHVAQGTANGQI